MRTSFLSLFLLASSISPALSHDDTRYGSDHVHSGIQMDVEEGMWGGGEYSLFFISSEDGNWVAFRDSTGRFYDCTNWNEICNGLYEGIIAGEEAGAAIPGFGEEAGGDGGEASGEAGQAAAEAAGQAAAGAAAGAAVGQAAGAAAAAAASVRKLLESSDSRRTSTFELVYYFDKMGKLEIRVVECERKRCGPQRK